MNQEEQTAEARARLAYIAWQQAQARRIAAADRAARLALELKAVNERLERKTHERAEHLSRLRGELVARAEAARAAYARRIQAQATRIRAARRAEELASTPVAAARSPVPRFAAAGMLILFLVGGLLVPMPIEPAAAESAPAVAAVARGEPLALRASDTLTLRRIP